MQTARVDDLNRIIEMKTVDLRKKQQALVEAQCELARLREDVNKLGHEVQCLRQHNDSLAHQNAETAKELSCMVSRNAEACCNIKKLEERLAGLESQLFCL